MAVYMVTWNLNREGGGYDQARRELVQHIERYDFCKDNGLESVRWVSTTWSADQVSNDLLTKLDKNDRLFVTRVPSGENAGWLSKDTWDWINARL